METIIKNHIEELQLSAERMLLLHSDNKVLISYFKDLKEKLLYLKELSILETKFEWSAIEGFMDLLKNQDEQLSHINLEFQIREKEHKHYAFIKIKK